MREDIYEEDPSAIAANLGHFWTAKNWRVSMHSDGGQFIAQINAGITGETYLSVGYSCPNYAWITEKMIPFINAALDECYERLVPKDLEDMLPDLFQLCRVANKVYNSLL